MDKLNEALRLVRVFHDKKIKDLAAELDVSPSFITDIEKGNKKPSLELVDKYAKVFNTTKSALLFFSEEIEKGASKSKCKMLIRDYMLKFLKAVEEKAFKDECP
ncbi:TPA: transcriptional regulator [Candidatus Gastranaerophilales bacterium HUM_16]|nr:MAG TPA: transcriptional regulator [Candidatus Gastranaerophilales bacterium HUM_16]